MGHQFLDVLTTVRRRLGVAIGAEQAQVVEMVILVVAVFVVEFQGDWFSEPLRIVA